MAVLHCLTQLITESGLIHLEKAQGVAHGKDVFVVASVFDGAGEGRGGEADLNAVEVFENAAPFAIDAAVAFIGDDQVEIARRVVAVNVDHALQRGDGNTFFILKAPPGAQHIAGEIR